MAKEVDLSSYWMPVLRQIKELKEIARAEEPEIRYLLEAVDHTLNSMFIDTADEYGIGRFEEMLGIVPDEGDTLSTRRYRVSSKWSNANTYTINELHDILTSYCGEGNFEIIERYSEYILEIVANLPVRGALEIVYNSLIEILPCNMIMILKNVLEEICTPNIFVGAAVSTAMVYSVSCAEEGEQKKLTVEIPLHSATAGSVGVVATVITDVI